MQKWPTPNRQKLSAYFLRASHHFGYNKVRLSQLRWLCTNAESVVERRMCFKARRLGWLFLLRCRQCVMYRTLDR